MDTPPTGKRPLPRLLGLGELQERNKRAAEKELAADRADCIRHLRAVHTYQGMRAVQALLTEALPGQAPARAKRSA